MSLIRKIRNKISNIYVMTWRCILNSLRTSDILVSTIVLPIVILLVAAGLFSGAIDTGDMEYIDFMLPGLLVLCSG